MSDPDINRPPKFPQHQGWLNKLQTFHARVDATCRVLGRFTPAEFRRKFGFIDPKEFGYNSIENLFLMRGCDRADAGIFTYSYDTATALKTKLVLANVPFQKFDRREFSIAYRKFFLERSVDLKKTGIDSPKHDYFKTMGAASKDRVSVKAKRDGNEVQEVGDDSFFEDEMRLLQWQEELRQFRRTVDDLIGRLQKFTEQYFMCKIREYSLKYFGYESVRQLLLSRGCVAHGECFTYNLLDVFRERAYVLAKKLGRFTTAEFCDGWGGTVPTISRVTSVSKPLAQLLPTVPGVKVIVQPGKLLLFIFNMPPLKKRVAGIDYVKEPMPQRIYGISCERDPEDPERDFLIQVRVEERSQGENQLRPGNRLKTLCERPLGIQRARMQPTIVRRSDGSTPQPQTTTAQKSPIPLPKQTQEAADLPNGTLLHSEDPTSAQQKPVSSPLSQQTIQEKFSRDRAPGGFRRRTQACSVATKLVSTSSAQQINQQEPSGLGQGDRHQPQSQPGHAQQMPIPAIHHQQTVAGRIPLQPGFHSISHQTMPHYQQMIPQGATEFGGFAWNPHLQQYCVTYQQMPSIPPPTLNPPVATFFGDYMRSEIPSLLSIDMRRPRGQPDEYQGPSLPKRLRADVSLEAPSFLPHLGAVNVHPDNEGGLHRKKNKKKGEKRKIPTVVDSADEDEGSASPRKKAKEANKPQRPGLSKAQRRRLRKKKQNQSRVAPGSQSVEQVQNGQSPDEAILTRREEVGAQEEGSGENTASRAPLANKENVNVDDHGDEKDSGKEEDVTTETGIAPRSPIIQTEEQMKGEEGDEVAIPEPNGEVGAKKYRHGKRKKPKIMIVIDSDKEEEGSNALANDARDDGPRKAYAQGELHPASLVQSKQGFEEVASDGETISKEAETDKMPAKKQKDKVVIVIDSDEEEGSFDTGLGTKEVSTETSTSATQGVIRLAALPHPSRVVEEVPNDEEAASKGKEAGNARGKKKKKKIMRIVLGSDGEEEEPTSAVNGAAGSFSKISGPGIQKEARPASLIQTKEEDDDVVGDTSEETVQGPKRNENEVKLNTSSVVEPQPIPSVSPGQNPSQLSNDQTVIQRILQGQWAQEKMAIIASQTQQLVQPAAAGSSAATTPETSSSLPHLVASPQLIQSCVADLMGRFHNELMNTLVIGAMEKGMNPNELGKKILELFFEERPPP